MLPFTRQIHIASDFARGTVWVPVSFAACGARPEDPRFHTATLRNGGLDPVRVIRFGVYRPDGVVYRLYVNSCSGKILSRERDRRRN